MYLILIYFQKKGAVKMNENPMDAEKQSEAIERISDDNENACQGYFERGLSYAQAGEFEKAVSNFNKAIEHISGDSANACIIYYNRGLVYAKSSEFEKAGSDFNKAIECFPDNGDDAFRVLVYSGRGLAYANTGIAYAKSGETEKAVGKFENGIKDYDKVIELSPENADAYYYRGASYMSLERAQEAIHDFEKFLELDPDNENAEIARAALKNMSGGGASRSGCYVATCVYGSYDCPEVWTLRRYRDSKLSNSWFGRRFIRFYYAVSPKIVELFGDRKWFNGVCKPVLNKIVIVLQNSGIDSGPYSEKGVETIKPQSVKTAASNS
jgi:tetratricopeptide (TPR) repeat protein